MHNGFLQVEGQKMSKSLGNFITINDVLSERLSTLVPLEREGQTRLIERSWNGLSARFSMIQTHYREPIDWTRTRLMDSSDELYRWYEILRDASFDYSLQTDVNKPIVDALSDDLNTWQAITVLRSAAKKRDVRLLGEGMNLLGLLDPLFLDGDGILIFDRSAEVDKAAVDEAIAARLAFIAQKNWAEADRIRDELLGQGVQLKDGKDPATGERITTWEVKR
jgi:cysteinyl-tRNA synthetase